MAKKPKKKSRVMKTVTETRAESAGVAVQEPVTAPPSEIPAVAESVAISPAVPVSADELIAPLVAGMPEPTDSPLGANPDGSPHPDAPKLGQVDTAGVVFDPEKHKADETGRPKTDVNGRFYAKNVGRKKGQASAPKSEPANDTPEFEVINNGNGSTAGAGAIPADAGPSPTGGNGIRDRFDHMANIYCQGGYGVATTFFADDGWQPKNAAEHEGLRSAVAAYLRAKNSEELPPGAILTLAISAYAGERITRPKTKEKLLLLWLRIRPWFGFKNKPGVSDIESESES